MTHTHPGHTAWVQRPANSTATTPNMAAPTAAVAIQPYQYIAGARNPNAGSATSRVWCVPATTTPSEGRTVKTARSLARATTHRTANVDPKENVKLAIGAEYITRENPEWWWTRQRSGRH